MKKTCMNCKYRDMDYSSEYPCCECSSKSQWEDINYQPTAEDLIITELEKIKHEIGEIRMKEPLMSRGFECYGFKDKTAEDIKTEIIELLKNHIYELKGENE